MRSLRLATAIAAISLSTFTIAQAADEPSFGECSVTGKFQSVSMQTVTPDTLTIAAILPAPDSFKGDSPETITGGFEYCLGANIAYRAGLHNIVVQNVPWPALIAGQLSGFDVAMTNIYITAERLEKVDFTVPYFKVASGVMVRTEDEGKITAENIGTQRLGVFLASVQDKFLTETLKPTGEVKRFESTADMFTALKAGQVDALIFDMSGLLPAAGTSGGTMKVVGAYPVGGDVGGVLVKGSAAKAQFDAAIADMEKDGTINALVAKWYVPLYGGVDPASIPVWK